MTNLNLGELDLTTDELILDEVDSKATFSFTESHVVTRIQRRSQLNNTFSVPPRVQIM